MPDQDEEYKFDIHASIVFQLGESLITDEVQALVELVKNCYDADSTYAQVEVNSSEYPKEGRYTKAMGYLTIEDGGQGMSLEDIRNGWLLISNSPKRTLKRSKKSTPRGRTPLGDKGLGRLGAQRLGDNLEIYTYSSADQTEYYVAFSWLDFMSQDRLSSVPVVVQEVTPATRKKGTRLVISGLKKPMAWRDTNSVNGESRLDQLQTELSRLISPFDVINDFRVSARIDGTKLSLWSLSAKLRETAQIRYSLTFQDGLFSSHGRARISFFRPETNNEAEQQLFRELIEQDNGLEFFGFLTEQKEAQRHQFKLSKRAGWFVEYSFRKPLAEFDGVQQVESEGQEVVDANPGPFQAEIDAFDLGRESASHQNVYQAATDYRKYVKLHSGIRVYRNGFQVRTDADWLKLGEDWTRGGSWYGLKPSNTIGYVAISSRDNSELVETTDREGFVKNPYYENFYLMLRKFVEEANNAQEVIRRSWVRYRKLHIAKLARVTSDSTPESLVTNMRQTILRAQELRQPLENATANLEAAVINSASVSREIANELPIDSNSRRLSRENARQLARTVKSASKIAAELGGYLSNLAELDSVTKVIAEQIDTLREQLGQVYEMVSLGLTAEVLSHEVLNIADQLAERTRQIERHVNGQGSSDRRLVTYIEYVKTSIAGLRKQLAHFAPALKYVREKREQIPMGAFVQEIAEYYALRFSSKDIRVNGKLKDAHDFGITMNKGKLTQIVDNLFLNSEYWLSEDLRLGRIKQGVITIEVIRPFLRIYDNGRGIDSSVQASLFEPFITTKKRGEGRGLGLFVVHQLLETEGCTITLLPNLNSSNRRYIFELDFTGGMTNDAE
jgi:signal transduction histidine kinase